MPSKPRTDNLKRSYGNKNFKYEGLDELREAVKQAGEVPAEVIIDTIRAATTRLAEETRKVAMEMDIYDEESNVHIVNKVMTSKPTVKENKSYGYVQFSGSRKRGEKKTKTTNSEIAFMNEYGSKKRGITRKLFMYKAIKQSWKDAVDAASEVFFDWQKKIL